MMENKVNANALIEQLIALEYAIRQSIVVRDDQEEIADPHHIEEAIRCGVKVSDEMTKGDLLGAVQTMARKK